MVSIRVDKNTLLTATSLTNKQVYLWSEMGP